jgi:hypothetical protein
MADKKISQLDNATTALAGTEVLPIVQSGTTKQVSVANLTAGRAVGGLSFATANVTVGASAVTAGADISYSVNSGGTQKLEAGYTTGSFRPALKLYSVGSSHDMIAQFTDLFRFYNAAGDMKFYVDHLNSKVGSSYNLAFDSGKGIDFSATASGSGTMTSELLADYEEGTFSPTVIGTTSAGTVTYANQLGKYTKIGRLVTVEIYLNWSSGTGTGNLAFGGLPFTIGSNVYGSAPIWGEVSLTASQYLTTRLLPGGTVIDPFNSPVGGGVTNPVAYVASGGVMITATYSV